MQRWGWVGRSIFLWTSPNFYLHQGPKKESLLNRDNFFFRGVEQFIAFLPPGFSTNRHCTHDWSPFNSGGKGDWKIELKSDPEPARNIYSDASIGRRPSQDVRCKWVSYPPTKTSKRPRDRSDFQFSQWLLWSSHSQEVARAINQSESRRRPKQTEPGRGVGLAKKVVEKGNVVQKERGH